MSLWIFDWVSWFSDNFTTCYTTLFHMFYYKKTQIAVHNFDNQFIKWNTNKFNKTITRQSIWFSLNCGENDEKKNKSWKSIRCNCKIKFQSIKSQFKCTAVDIKYTDKCYLLFFYQLPQKYTQSTSRQFMYLLILS